MKTILAAVASIMLVSAAPVRAADFPWLLVTTADGTTWTKVGVSPSKDVCLYVGRNALSPYSVTHVTDAVCIELRPHFTWTITDSKGKLVSISR